MKIYAYIYRNILFISAIAVAAALRFYQITYQVIADDEWHSLHKISSLTMAGILSNPGETTDSVPLTVFYKFMLDHVILSEWVMQGPSLLFGMLTVIVLPIAARTVIGRPATIVFAWLIAISPLLIFYSRLARPYAFIPVLALGGVMAFLKWRGGNGKKWAVIYVICAVAAPYLHLTALPFLIAPLVVLPLEKLWLRYKVNQSAKAPKIETVIVYTVVSALLSLLVYFVLSDRSGSFSAKIAKDRPTIETFLESLKLFYGTSCSWIVAVLFAAGVIGVWQIIRTRPRFALYVFTACLFQTVFIVLSAPYASVIPAVFARYTLSKLPVMLLLSAVGLVCMRNILPRLPHLISVIVVLFLIIFSPLKKIYYRPNSFTNHLLFQHDYNPDNKYSRKLCPKSMPQFYYDLQKIDRDSITIVESPWYYSYQSNVIYVYYQQLHRQRVVIGFVGTDLLHFGEFPFNKRARFRNFVHLSDYQDLKRRKVKYVVFHKNLINEVTSTYSNAEAVDMAHWIKYYKLIFGDPVYTDDNIVVFDVQHKD
ncbi:hypothetical protein [Candidatus Magnetominusculus dajiuhuensis]|uniref:hypothetical protein n=1 Tax=Candidatus Magnetominusculus dajiuhuensis TaxID=3137712 RepID=UPI003B42FFA3